MRVPVRGPASSKPFAASTLIASRTTVLDTSNSRLHGSGSTTLARRRWLDD